MTYNNFFLLNANFRTVTLSFIRQKNKRNENEGNNNDSLLLEAEMDVQVEDEGQFVIGIPAPDYNINKSVFYTHYFYKKIQREDGTVVDKCNVRWENKKKEIFIKVSEDEDVFYLYFIIFKFRSPMVILRG